MRRRAFIEGSLAILVECGLSTNALHYSGTLPEVPFVSREKRKKKGRQNVYEIHIPSGSRASPDPLKAGTKKPPHDQVCLYLTSPLGGTGINMLKASGGKRFVERNVCGF